MSEPSSSISTHRSAVTRYHTRRSAPSSRHSSKSPSPARATVIAARPSAWAADARPTGRQAPTPPPPGSTTAASNAPAEAHSSSSSSSSHHRHNGSKRYSAPAKHAEQPAWHRHRTDSHPPLPARGAAAPAAAPSASPQSLSSTSSSLAAAEAHLGQAVASASARADAGLLPAPLRALLRVASERGVDVLTWLAPEGGWPSSDSASTAGKHSSSSSSSVNGAIASPSIPPPVAQYVLSADVFKEKLTQLGLGLAVIIDHTLLYCLLLLFYWPAHRCMFYNTNRFAMSIHLWHQWYNSLYHFFLARGSISLLGRWAAPWLNKWRSSAPLLPTLWSMPPCFSRLPRGLLRCLPPIRILRKLSLAVAWATRLRRLWR